MNLDEAILHAEQKADENEKSAKYMKKKYGDHVIGYSIHCKCAEEHRQLAKWLVELRERRKAEEGET